MDDHIRENLGGPPSDLDKILDIQGRPPLDKDNNLPNKDNFTNNNAAHSTNSDSIQLSQMWRLSCNLTSVFTQTQFLQKSAGVRRLSPEGSPKTYLVHNTQRITSNKNEGKSVANEQEQLEINSDTVEPTEPGMPQRFPWQTFLQSVCLVCRTDQMKNFY